MKKKKFLFAFLTAGMAVGMCPASALAEYPERSIELVVPADPGGDTDANARALAAALNETMGQNVIVSNMSGSSGAVAHGDVLNNPDDGYRFVFFHSGACISQLMGLYDFDILEDFKLVGMPFLDYSNAFLINANNEKFSDLDSMVAYMKEHPGEVTFATETGNFTHLQVLAFEEAAGVTFNIVDAGTAAQKITELLGQRLDVIATQAGLVLDYIDNEDESQKFICLGILADEPIEARPDLLTMKEQGYDVVFSKFFYLAAPNDVDDEVIEIMNEALAKVVENEALLEYANGALVNVSYMTPDETEEYWKSQYDIYASYLADYIE